MTVWAWIQRCWTKRDGKTHYGLSNVKTRLMIFYEKNAEVICNSAPGIGTTITLKFPKKEDMEEYNG